VPPQGREVCVRVCVLARVCVWMGVCVCVYSKKIKEREQE